MATLQNFSIAGLQDSGNLISNLEGRVVLAVNVASKCGLTPHYEGLQKLYDELSSAGLTVVGFPCNQFGGQEPGTPDEIAAWGRMPAPERKRLMAELPERAPLTQRRRGGRGRNKG